FAHRVDEGAQAAAVGGAEGHRGPLAVGLQSLGDLDVFRAVGFLLFHVGPSLRRPLGACASRCLASPPGRHPRCPDAGGGPRALSRGRPWRYLNLTSRTTSAPSTAFAFERMASRW